MFKFFSLGRRISFIQRRPWLKQLIKFSFVGGFCAILDFSVYIILTRFFDFWQTYYLWANFVAAVSAATINFIWNRKWTFRVKTGNVFQQYLKFWIAMVSGILVYQAILYISVEKLNFLDLLGKAIGAILAMLLRFFINKFWTFR